MAEKSIIVLDNFYSDPHHIRQRAFEMEWLDKYGNHPGKRTYADRHPSVKSALENAIGKKITNWDEDWNTHNGAYNLCKQTDRCWIHSDWGTSWACVVYLTPDAPLSSGTGLYQHKKTGFRSPHDAKTPEEKALAKEFEKNDALDFTAWELTDYVGNVFNRAVLYAGHYYHSAVQYFGHSDEYCRMHQTFFFSTEN